jgi:hypothetical protein
MPLRRPPIPRRRENDTGLLSRALAVRSAASCRPEASLCSSALGIHDAEYVVDSNDAEYVVDSNDAEYVVDLDSRGVGSL